MRIIEQEGKRQNQDLLSSLRQENYLNFCEEHVLQPQTFHGIVRGKRC